MVQEFRNKFDIIFHKSLDIIVIVDGQSGRILDINRVVYEILGYDREALIGQPFAALCPARSELSPQEVLEQVHIHGAVIAAQEFVRADGAVCPMDVTVNIVPWDKDRAILVTLRDVTERWQAEMAQKKLIQELDAFAHTVAHDLKSLLTVIVGATQSLNYPTPLPNDRQAMVELIVRNGKKMVSVVDALLLLAEVRDTEVEIAPLDMAAIIAEVLERLSHLIDEKQAEIILPSRWPSALGYAPWIEEVWANYLSNALKYGGLPPRIELGGEIESDQQGRFWIRDNGPGLTPEEQQLLFTRFTRLARGRQGHGLGLSIVLGIVEKLGGQVGIESEVGQGSLFSFTLPLAAEPNSAP